MVRQAADPPQQRHPLDDDVDDDLPDDHKGEEVGKCGNDERKKGVPATTMRSKHSETEQRRRSKINERFQTLRDLIPQNDQKRDKASFLLEVIGHVQFLQEKLQMYEGSYHGYNRDQNKLTSWGGKSASLESHVDPSQNLNGGANQDDKDSTTQAVVLTDVKKMLELQEDPIAAGDTQTHANIFPYIQHGVLATDHPTEPVVADLASDPQTNQVWPMPVTAQCLFPNNIENDQEQLTSQSDYSSFSSAFCQGIVNNLTHALQSSGVDLSQASISVKIDVRKQGGETKDLDCVDHSTDQT